jgi:hypothetical protein
MKIRQETGATEKSKDEKGKRPKIRAREENFVLLNRETRKRKKDMLSFTLRSWELACENCFA